ncbi:Hint domain-containing protein [Lipingzhangella halophila]|nr:Hint domain-containing protein [Lipingzhangella halophila]
MAFGLPGDVRSLLERSMCLIPGDQECEDPAAGEGDESGDGSGGEDDESGDEDDESGGGEESGDEGDGGEESGDDAADIDPELTEALIGAEGELADAEEELEDAQSDFDEIKDELLQLLKELIGLQDAEDCLTEGDIVACIWTVVGFAPWGKAAKVAKKIPAIARLVTKWRRRSGRLDDAEDAASTARGNRDEALEACTSRNSFVAGTPVLLANGGYRPIEEIGIGDLVRTTDPASGETRAGAVTNTISGEGPKDLVDVWILTGEGAERVTSTGEHRFRVDGTWMPAADLSPGDRLRTAAGSTAVVSGLNGFAAHRDVYDLTVATTHTYYVGQGAGNALVHNAGPCPDLDSLSQSARKPAKGPGKTQAGRSYQKHRDRGELPDVPNSELKNAGEELVDDILTSPDTRVQNVTGGQGKGGTRFIMSRPGQRDVGITYDANGEFLYFGLF